MTEMTPETLRARAFRMRPHQCGDGLRDDVLAHADAWRADHNKLVTTEAENRILMKNAYPFGNFCCGLRDMGPGIHEAGCEIAAALAAEETTTVYATTISDEDGHSLGDDAALAAEET